MNNDDLFREWSEIADLDLSSAEFLLQMTPKPLEIICYHSQQCAEKYLKGFIAHNGGVIPKTHDLLSLNKECSKYNPLMKQIENICIELTDYGVMVRYPFHIEIDENDAELALTNARRIKEFVLNLISK